MDANFWFKRWQENNIAFHESEPNSLLVKYFEVLSLSKGSRIFLPLCGKTLDIAWLLGTGYRVVGAELSEIAVKQLFMALGVEPQVSTIGKIKHYSEQNIDIFVGDIFDLTSSILGSVDAIYDRAALVALPDTMRSRYTDHLMQLTDKAPQLLICFEYEQSVMAGPPFSISNEEVRQHYENSYTLNLLTTVDVPGGLKKQCAAKENIWLLHKFEEA